MLRPPLRPNGRADFQRVEESRWQHFEQILAMADGEREAQEQDSSLRRKRNEQKTRLLRERRAQTYEQRKVSKEKIDEHKHKNQAIAAKASHESSTRRAARVSRENEWRAEKQELKKVVIDPARRQEDRRAFVDRKKEEARKARSKRTQLTMEAEEHTAAQLAARQQQASQLRQEAGNVLESTRYAYRQRRTAVLTKKEQSAVWSKERQKASADFKLKLDLRKLKAVEHARPSKHQLLAQRLEGADAVRTKKQTWAGSIVQQRQLLREKHRQAVQAQLEAVPAALVSAMVSHPSFKSYLAVKADAQSVLSRTILASRSPSVVRDLVLTHEIAHEIDSSPTEASVSSESGASERGEEEVTLEEGRNHVPNRGAELDEGSSKQQPDEPSWWSGIALPWLW